MRNTYEPLLFLNIVVMAITCSMMYIQDTNLMKLYILLGFENQKFSSI